MNMPLWFSNLLYWSLQVALLAIAAAVLPRLLQLRQPRVLLVYWRSLIALSLLLPFLQPWHRPPSTAMVVVATTFSPATLPAPASPPASHWHLSGEALANFVAFLILAGIVVRFAMLALGLFKLRQLRRVSTPISQWPEAAALLEAMRSRTQAAAEFRVSRQVDSPVTFGFAAPLILLPEKFPSLDPRFQSAIACHELLHIRRRDWAHHLGEEILSGLFWFHPAIAWLVSRARLAREQVVDLEVVRLTEARKPYVEALLEFTSGRRAIAAVPAPPFLAERQLVERVSLMLKEVRMSRSRLIASLVVISCCLVVVIALVAWTFPLKAAPLPAQSAPRAGVTGGVAGGVSGGASNAPSGGTSGGIDGGVVGGISSDTANRGQANEPDVDYSTIWVDTVKRGLMVRQVRGLGTLVRDDGSGELIARITLPESMTQEVRVNQNASVGVRGDLNATANQRTIAGHVIRIGPRDSGETQYVDIDIDRARKFAFSSGTQVDGVIDIEKLGDVLQVGRPVHAVSNASASVFRIVNEGKEAERVEVKFGRASVNTIEVLDGLKEGDKIILSDMATVESAPRIRLTDEKHTTSH